MADRLRRRKNPNRHLLLPVSLTRRIRLFERRFAANPSSTCNRLQAH